MKKPVSKTDLKKWEKSPEDKKQDAAQAKRGVKEGSPKDKAADQRGAKKMAGKKK